MQRSGDAEYFPDSNRDCSLFRSVGPAQQFCYNSNPSNPSIAKYIQPMLLTSNDLLDERINEYILHENVEEADSIHTC